MRVAIFSDVHGNLTALRAVLDDIDSRSDLDEIVFAGDLCLFGPRPKECLEVVREREIGTLVGNADLWVHNPPPISDALPDELRQRRRYIAAMSEWTLAQLDFDSAAWLEELGTVKERRISPTVNPRDDLLIVHANPLDLFQIIFPPETEQQSRYGRVRQSDDELEPLLSGVDTGIIAFGHLHIPSVRDWRHITLANISSVSLPGDGDPRAKYGILTWDGHRWHVEHVRVSFPIEEEIEAYRQKQPPAWEETVQILADEGMFPQTV